jgi:hypothetical protein
MKTVDWKDVLVRAVKTFVEAVLAFGVAELSGKDIFVLTRDMWGALAISAAAAGISAVWNGVIEPLVKTKE